MVSKLIALVKKNIKLLLRTKSSALIVIFGPLLLILLIGAAFNTANLYGIRVGAYAAEYSGLTNAIIDGLERERVSVLRIEGEQSCVESIKRGVIHVCAIFPAGLNVKEGGEIKFYVDNSRLNLVYVVMDKISKEVGAKSEELSAQLTKSIVDTLELAGKEIEDKSGLISVLVESNRDASERIDFVIEKLQGLNLEFDINDFPFSSLEREINSSATAVGLLSRLRIEVQGVEGRLDEAASARKASSDKLVEVRAKLTGNLDYIKAVEAALMGIREDVKNVKLTSVGSIVSPIRTRIEPIVAEKTSLNYLFPTLVAMVVMFVSIFLATTLEVREKAAKIYFKNFITPTSDLLFIVGDFITNMIVVLLQLIVLFGAAFIFFRAQLLPVIGQVFGVLLLMTAVFILLGMVIGNLFRSEETGMLAATSVGFILLFFSSAIVPIEVLPDLLGKIASFSPFFISEGLLNKLLLFQVSLESVAMQLYILAGYLIGLIFVVIVTKKIGKGGG